METLGCYVAINFCCFPGLSGIRVFSYRQFKFQAIRIKERQVLLPEFLGWFIINNPVSIETFHPEIKTALRNRIPDLGSHACTSPSLPGTFVRKKGKNGTSAA